MNIINTIGERWIDHLTFPTYLGFSPSENMPDEKLLPIFKNIDLDKGKHFIILHQRASHSPYGALLNDNDRIFGNSTLDNYDNTIYKTDTFIRDVFTYLDNRKKDDWLLLYTSDHGQYVTENISKQGTPDKPNYTVPFFFYTPNSALQQETAQLFSSCEKVYHQQISIRLIQLLGYQMPMTDCKKVF